MAESPQEPYNNMAMPGCSLKKSPSYREAQELLSRHVKRQKLLKKYSGQSTEMSPLDVRKEAEKILNEFLKRQLKKDLRNSPLLSHKYQQVVVEDEYEQTQHLDDEVIMKGENFSGDEIPVTESYASVDAIDDIPFMDGVEEGISNDGRSRSLPGAIQFSVKSDQGLPKSYSLSPQSLLKGDKPVSPRKRSSAKLDSPSLSSHSKSPSFVAEGPGSVPKSAEDYPPEPQKVRRRFRSGSVSSSDTDSGAIVSPNRKKKTVFKRLQERFARAVSRDREKMDLDGGRGSPDDAKKKIKKRKARSKKRTDKHSGSEILKERHTHKEGHIEQHHDSENKDILLRTDETWESTDITDFEKSQSKHIDTHRKVKESTDISGSSEKGILGALKRITSRKGKNKSHKSSLKASQSAYTQDNSGKSSISYDRVLSLPSGSPDLNLHKSETTLQTGGGKYRQTTSTITSPRANGRGHEQGLPRMGPVHEKSRSEPVQPTPPMVTNCHDTTGHTIPHGFHFRQVSGNNNVKIPENKSFQIDYSIDEKERIIRTNDGEVVKETNIHRSRRPPSDLEIDGAGASLMAGGRSPRPRTTPQESDLDDEIDDLRISRMAQRIAEMGDSYMHTNESSVVGSPVSNSDERDGEGLTELERKLRDCFRDFGDSINHKLTMSVEPKEAAVNIAKQVTYSKFKDTVGEVVGDSVGWQQLAMLFYVTKKATQLAGAGGAVAAQLKENCLQYVEDHFANWILNQGGWDSVLESDETDFDID